MSRELEVLFESEAKNLDDWAVGKIPRHYKRITASEDEQRRLAILGATTLCPAFGIRLFFTQALLAGAILSGDYDEVIVATPSQYGKSWLLGHIALYRAWKGAEQYIAAGTTNLTQIIMTQTILATQEASPEIRNSLLERPTDIDRLTTSLSKQKLAFKKGGFVEALSLGDTYGDSVTSNRAVGRGRDFFVDEAALVSEKAFIEMGRREFAKVDGSKYLSVLISNPHRPGVFYDKLTQQNPNERTLILWMDALTAVEEGRFKKKQVFESEFAKHRSTLKRYLLCVLDEEAGGMSELTQPTRAKTTSRFP